MPRAEPASASASIIPTIPTVWNRSQNITGLPCRQTWAELALPQSCAHDRGQSHGLEMRRAARYTALPMRFRHWPNVISASCLLTLLLIAPAGAAFTDEEEGWVQEYVPDGKTWKEQEVEPPSWPDPGRLLEVSVNRASFPFRVYIDPDSVSIGDDRVLRYTVVVVSQTGARNISYEGIRCSKRSYRRYAFGADAGWAPLAAEPPSR